MKRVELFEFEDFQWFPSFIRSSLTNLIRVLHRMMGTSDVLASLISEKAGQVSITQVVDLGSGSGGPMIDAISTLNQSDNNKQPINLILTDKYPNQQIVKQINDQNLPHIKYENNSVDAHFIDKAPKGLKTMIASFHHMSPTSAQKILKSAEQNKEPILIYEIAENKIPFTIWLLLLPLSLVILMIMTWLMTPFVRPLKFSQLLFTYLIPIIPIVYAWDGQASLMRTYTFDDIKSLIGDTENPHYRWEMAPAEKANGKKVGYYVFGCPQ